MKSHLMRFVRVAAAAFFVALAGTAPALAQWQVPDHAVPLGRGAGWTGFKSAAPAAAGSVLTSNGASADPSFQSQSFFPYVCNGTADSGPAHAADVAAQAAGKPLYFVGPTCLFETPVTPVVGAHWIGGGYQNTTIYGTSATATIINISNGFVTIEGFAIQSTVPRTSGYFINITAGGVRLKDLVLTAPATGIRWAGNGGIGLSMLNVSVGNAIATSGVSFQMEACTACVFEFISASAPSNPALHPNAHFLIKSATDVTCSNCTFFQAQNVVWFAPGTGDSVSSVKFIGGYADSGSQYGVYMQPSGSGSILHVDFTDFWAWGLTGAIGAVGTGSNIDGVTFDNVDMFSGGIGASFSGGQNISFKNSKLGPLTSGIVMASVAGCQISGNLIGHNGTVTTGITLSGTTDNCDIVHNNFIAATTAVTNTASGTHNTFGPNIGYNPVGFPTGMVQGDLLYMSDATGHLARLAKDTNATRAICNTGTSNNPAWCQIDLSNGVTSRLPFANLTQGSARSVLGVTGNATADVASIQGSAGQMLGVPNAGTSLAFTSTPQLGVSGTLGSLTFGNATSGLLTIQPVTGALGTVTLSLPAATDTLVGKATTDELTNKTLTAAVGKGTWTASGTWTLPAFTLGGTVSGGNNQINNVVIGASTPRAGTFTTLNTSDVVTASFSTSAGSGVVRGFIGSTTRTTTSGTTDSTTGFDYAFTDSGTTASAALAAFNVTSTYSNANNTGNFNSGFRHAFQPTANLTRFDGMSLNATAFGGTTGTYNALYIGAWANAGGTITTARAMLIDAGAGPIAQNDVSGVLSAGPVAAMNATSIPAGGTAGKGLLVSSTSNFGVFFGSGAPSLSAAKGSIYLRSDGSGTGDRMYINTNGSTTWTAVTTASWLLKRDLNPANDNTPAFMNLAA